MDKDIVCSRITFALQEKPQGCTNLGTSSPRGQMAVEITDMRGDMRGGGEGL